MLRTVKTWGGGDPQEFIQSKYKIRDSRQGSTIKHYCLASALCLAYHHLEEDLTSECWALNTVSDELERQIL